MFTPEKRQPATEVALTDAIHINASKRHFVTEPRVTGYD
jgi:hypothetical protein